MGDKKRVHHFVLSAMESTKFRINDLKKLLAAQHPDVKCGKLQFGKEAVLNDRLKLIKGSVTPFGILNDEKKETVLLIDANLLNHEFSKFHPLVNTMTMRVHLQSFMDILKGMGFRYYVVKLD